MRPRRVKRARRKATTVRPVKRAPFGMAPPFLAGPVAVRTPAFVACRVYLAHVSDDRARGGKAAGIIFFGWGPRAPHRKILMLPADRLARGGVKILGALRWGVGWLTPDHVPSTPHPRPQNRVGEVQRTSPTLFKLIRRAGQSPARPIELPRRTLSGAQIILGSPPQSGGGSSKSKWRPRCAASLS